MLRKFAFVTIAVGTFIVTPISAEAGSHRGLFGNSHYSHSQGGHYVGGHGSSHRGGHYVNARTGNHNRHHRW